MQRFGGHAVSVFSADFLLGNSATGACNALLPMKGLRVQGKSDRKRLKLCKRPRVSSCRGGSFRFKGLVDYGKGLDVGGLLALSVWFSTRHLSSLKLNGYFEP